MWVEDLTPFFPSPSQPWKGGQKNSWVGRESFPPRCQAQTGPSRPPPPPPDTPLWAERACPSGSKRHKGKTGVTLAAASGPGVLTAALPGTRPHPRSRQETVPSGDSRPHTRPPRLCPQLRRPQPARPGGKPLPAHPSRPRRPAAPLPRAPRAVPSRTRAGREPGLGGQSRLPGPRAQQAGAGRGRGAGGRPLAQGPLWKAPAGTRGSGADRGRPGRGAELRGGGPDPPGLRGPLTEADDGELRPGARRPLRPRGRPLLHAGAGRPRAPPPAPPAAAAAAARGKAPAPARAPAAAL